MSRPDPAVLPVGTLHSVEWFWVSRRIFIYSHHNTYVFSLRCPSVRPIFAYHTYYTSKHMYNWMKWLRLLGGWHFIAATAIKPPKAACQFAADDILLYKICYNIQWIYFTIWEKGKEELSPLQYHFKSLHIISRHYKKSLLRSQIYHGYEELSTDTNYPIWRRQKLPYMKKTRKKKQVCGAACFMAAEIKFSEDVRLERFPGICRGMHRGIGLKVYMLVYLHHLQKWLVYGRGLVIFQVLALFWLSETGQIWGFRAFPGERMEGMTWNFACWCILTTFRTD